MKDSLKQALYGQNAHVSTETIFDGISMKQASDADFTEHSIWQLLQHITYWQQFLLRQYQDDDMPVPTHSSDTWPKERVPESETHWKNAVMTYKNGLIELETFIDEIDDNADVSDILSIILHTSYHAGQVVLIRKHLSSWPPPSGGDSW